MTFFLRYVPSWSEVSDIFHNGIRIGWEICSIRTDLTDMECSLKSKDFEYDT